MNEIEKEDLNEPSTIPEESLLLEVEEDPAFLESTPLAPTYNSPTFEDRLQNAIDEALTTSLVNHAVEKAIEKAIKKALQKSIQAAVEKAVERLNSVSDDALSNLTSVDEKLVLHLGCPDPAGPKLGFIGQGGPTPCHTTTPKTPNPLNPNKKKPVKPK